MKITINSYMPDLKISEMTLATTISAGDVLILLQNGVNKKIFAENILTVDSTGALTISTTQGALGAGSISIGKDAAAPGDRALAIGEDATASGDYSISFRRNADATGNGSIVLGRGSTASGVDAITLGFDSVADGDNSITIGEHSVASGDNTVAIGRDKKSLVDNVVELGYDPNTTTRGGTLRIHDDGIVAASVYEDSSPITASLSAKGSEINGTIGDGLYAFRKDGTNLYIDLNDSGTIITKHIDSSFIDGYTLTGAALSGITSAVDLSVSDVDKWLSWDDNTNTITILIGPNIIPVGRTVNFEQLNTESIILSGVGGMTINGSSSYLLETSEQFSVMCVRGRTSTVATCFGERKLV